VITIGYGQLNTSSDYCNTLYGSVCCKLEDCVQIRCKNKREGKQLAAQAVLQLMHPQLTTWGSLLRLYAKSSEVKEKKVYHIVS